MGKTLDTLLLRRRFRTSKFKATVSLAISRLAVLKNQRQARCSVARSDVVEFLKTGNRDRALLRVEQVVKEQNMLDVFIVLEGYCHLLIERVSLFEQEKGCPEDLVEAVSSLIYAATRCGEFPELQELRAIFISRFGKEFAARATELRNNCGVNPKVIQKMSTRVPSLENKMKVVREIATDNNIDLPPEETSQDTSLEIQDSVQDKPEKAAGPSSPSGGERKESVRSDEIETGLPMRQYKDVADAAQAAFESAAYAAAAARAAVFLSRSESTDPDQPTTPSLHPRKAGFDENEDAIKTEIKLETIQPVDLRRSFSGSSSDSIDEEENIKQRNAVFDESDDEGEGGRGEFGSEMEKRSEGVEPLNIYRRPISVRTRWAQGR